MNNLKEYIIEKFKINSKSVEENKPYKYYPKYKKELMEIIINKMAELKSSDDLLDLNDIDVSCMEDMRNIFSNLNVCNIDISEWDVSNVTNMRAMFNGCRYLKSTGDLGNWDISKVEDFSFMFNGCQILRNIGDLSKWKIDGTKMAYAFQDCKQLKTIGAIEHWRPKESNWEIFPLCDLKPKPRSRV